MVNMYNNASYTNYTKITDGDELEFHKIKYMI